jgi:phosphate/sulfate permease
MFYHWAIPPGSKGYIESTEEKEVLREVEDKTKQIEGEGSESDLSSSSLAFKKQATPSIASTQGPATSVPSSIPSMQHYGQQYGMMPYGHQMGMMPPMGYGQPGVYGMGQGFGATHEIQPVIGRGFGLQPVEILAEDPWYTRWGKQLAPGFYMDIGELQEEDAAMHAQAFQAYPKTEEMFKMLQLTTCIFFSISHGANDIANALAPLASVWLVYDTGELGKKAPVPYWLLAYGALGLDIGLVMSGHHIMSALGNKLTLQSPSRGFCIELGAMLCVMVFSRNGVPVSTTHCLTGATTGVGLCNGNLKAVNWKLLGTIMGGWLVTCPAAGIVTGMVFWGIASAPSPMAGNGFFSGGFNEH